MRKLVAMAALLAALAAAGCARKEPETTAPPTPAADPLAARPQFPIAAMLTGKKGCTPEGTRSRAVVGLQTEAMVTALACGSRYENAGAYADYRRMTAANADVFSQATHDLISEFGSGKRATSGFDTEHTRLSNVVGMSASGENLYRYCDPRKEWFEALMQADMARLRSHAALVAEQMCEQQLAAEADAEKAASEQKLALASITPPRQDKPSSDRKQKALGKPTSAAKEKAERGATKPAKGAGGKPVESSAGKPAAGKPSKETAKKPPAKTAAPAPRDKG
jgi:hypothetical protein